MKLISLRGVAAALMLWSGLVHGEASASLEHKPAPVFVRTDVQHQRVDLAAYRGRVVLLTFWATWCAPCQLEMPRFVAWQDRDGAKGLQIVAVSMDDEPGPVVRLMRKQHVNYPVVMGDSKLAELYGGILGLPITYLIDRRGTIVVRFKGESNLDSMHARIEELLRQP